MPKSVPKSIQTCFEHVLGKIFRKFYAQCSMEGRVFENFLTNQKILKIQKCPKSFPKVSKHYLKMFWGKLFENFLPSFPWNVESLKIFKEKFFQNSKMTKSIPKSIQTCFEHVLGKIFRKFYAQCSMEGRVFENFLTNQKILKIQKCPKSFPKVSKPVLNMFWGKLFEKFLPSFPWNVESSTIFKKIYFQNSKNAQKCSKKYPNVF